MKVKWKCIFYNVVLPIIVAIVLFVIVGSWIIYETSRPLDPIDFNKSFQNMQQVQYTQPGAFSMAPIVMIILLAIMLSLMITVIRGMLKPCVIIENGIADNIAMGLSAIGELISIAICAGFGLFGILFIVIDIMLIKSVMSGNIITYGPEPVSVTIISGICFAISYGIYWLNKHAKD